MEERLLLELHQVDGNITALDPDVRAQIAAGPMSHQLLEEVDQDGRPTEQAKAHHQECALDLIPCSRPRRNTFRFSTTAFVRHWVARVRLQFPLRQDRPSDRAAMMKWLGAELMAHGLRPSHAENAGQLVVGLALLPSRAERTARELQERLRPRTNGERLLYSLASMWKQWVAEPLGISAATGTRNRPPPREPRYFDVRALK
jgi:hypothetical protein